MQYQGLNNFCTNITLPDSLYNYGLWNLNGYENDIEDFRIIAMILAVAISGCGSYPT